jgi:hypothetical protein
MNGQDQHIIFLELYRRQLRYEMDAMGYGPGNTPSRSPIRKTRWQQLVGRISGWVAALPLLIADKIIDAGDGEPLLIQVIDAFVDPNCCETCVGRTSNTTCWWCRGGQLPGLR